MDIETINTDSELLIKQIEEISIKGGKIELEPNLLNDGQFMEVLEMQLRRALQNVRKSVYKNL